MSVSRSASTVSSAPTTSRAPSIVWRKASPPFDDPDADIILQSSDYVSFHVHKFILSKSSPFFADVFASPSQGSPPPTPPDAGPRFIRMSDSARQLRILLGFCYPAAACDCTELDDVRVALGVASKYQLPRIRDCLQGNLLAHAEKEPERTYAIAWMFELRGVAAAAAYRSLAEPWLRGPTAPEFDNIPGTAVHRLLQYQRRCHQAALDVLGDPEMAWIPPSGPVSTTMQKPCSCISKWGRRLCKRAVAKWWFSYLDRARAALDRKPMGTAVRAPSLMSAPMVEVTQCRECAARLAEIALALEQFSELLGSEIDRKIAEVELDTPFEA